MKTSIVKFGMLFAAIGGIALTSCSSDNTTVDPVAQASCSDGIQNGSETGIDCGGTCPNSCTTEDTNLTGSLTSDRTLDPTKT